MSVQYKKVLEKGILIISLICMLVLYFVMLFRSQDNDLFFEVVSGRDLLQGNFSTASHLNNFPIIVQQWLYSVILSLFDRLGYVGHILFVFIQNVILWLLSGCFIYRKTKNKFLSIIAPVLMTLICFDYMINIRPQIITMITLVVVILILDIYRENKSIKYLIILLPILVLAANFHQAVFLYHIFVMVPFLLTEKNKIDFKLLIFTPIYVLCSLVTPYGIDGALYIFRTFQSDTYDMFKIGELSSIDITSIYGIRYAAILVLTIWLVHTKRSNRFINFYVLSISVLSIMACRHSSITFIELLLIVVVIDFEHLKICKGFLYGLITTLCIPGIILFSPNCIFDLCNGYGDVAEVIEDKDSLIYNSAVDVGGYMEYKGYTKLLMDSRSEAFSKEICGDESILNNLYITKKGYKIVDGNTVLASDEEILSVLKGYEYVLSVPLDKLNIVVEGDWIKLYDDGNYIIWKNPDIVDN